MPEVELELHRTTAKQYASFKKYVRKWAKKLHLENWTFYFEHSDDPEHDNEGHISWVQYHYEAQVAKMFFSKNWDIPYSAKICEMAAFHECFHLRFAPVSDLFDGSPLEPVLNKQEHLLIGCMEEIIFGKSTLMRESKGFN